MFCKVLRRAVDDGSSLQRLSPPQTFNKTCPLVYTQCQAIHTRSVFPCQDTPAARICYSARLNVPRQLSTVMAARHLERRSCLRRLDVVRGREGGGGVRDGAADFAVPVHFCSWRDWVQGGGAQD